jgi:hypothetical protein
MKIMSFEGTKKKQEPIVTMTCFCPVIGTHSAGAAGAAGAAGDFEHTLGTCFQPIQLQ